MDKTMADPLKVSSDAWDRLIEEAHQMARQAAAGNESLDIASQQRWLTRLGDLADAYMRSPAFLQTLSSSVKALCDAKSTLGGELPPSPESLVGAHWEAACKQLEEALRAAAPSFSQGPATATAAPTAAGASQAAAADRLAPWLDSVYELLLTRVSTAPEERGPPPAATSSEVVFQRGTLRLLRYRAPRPIAKEPVLICYALVNRPYILDFSADRSVVQRLLHGGFDVYLIDWGTPTEADRSWTLSDYVCQRLGRVVDWICHNTGADQLHLLGYCMGGTMSVLHTALFPQRIKSLTLLAAPIDFAGDESLLNLWAREEYFDVDRLIDTWGNCPGVFLQYSFQLMKPVQNFLAKYITLCRMLDDRGFIENFLAMEQWASDSIPIAGETFREFVKSLYQQNQLVKGEMYLDGKPIRLESITCPVLMLVAEHDHLVPPGSTLALKSHVGTSDVAALSVAAGHIGLAVSSKAHETLWPAATQWLQNRTA